jgi:hypothetical protein
MGLIAVAALALVGAATTVRAQVYHQQPGAPVVGETEAAVGATIGLGDDIVRLLGYGRFNVTEVSDVGIALVMDRFDPGHGADGWRFGAAADFKYAIVPTETTLPFDLSVDGGFGFQTGADVTNIDIPVGGVISRPLALSDDRVLEPYGGLYLVIRHVSVDTPPGAPDASDTDLDVELRLGASIEVGGGTSAFATVHVGDLDMFFLGVNVSL